MRSVDAIRARAKEKGGNIGAFMERLLDGPLPWIKMRQAYCLLRLCDRYGVERVEALCGRSLAFDVIDVMRIDRMLKTAQKAEQPVHRDPRQPCPSGAHPISGVRTYRSAKRTCGSGGRPASFGPCE